jgi:hypothetical protein
LIFPQKNPAKAGFAEAKKDQWNCSSSVEPDKALTLEEPP